VKYNITATPEFEKALEKTTESLRKAISIKIESLETKPDRKGKRLLSPLDRYFCLNILGQYQIIYTVNRKLKKVTLVSVRPIL